MTTQAVLLNSSPKQQLERAPHTRLAVSPCIAVSPCPLDWLCPRMPGPTGCVPVCPTGCGCVWPDETQGTQANREEFLKSLNMALHFQARGERNIAPPRPVLGERGMGGEGPDRAESVEIGAFLCNIPSSGWTTVSAPSSPTNLAQRPGGRREPDRSRWYLGTQSRARFFCCLTRFRQAWLCPPLLGCVPLCLTRFRQAWLCPPLLGL